MSNATILGDLQVWMSKLLLKNCAQVNFNILYLENFKDLVVSKI